MKVNDIRQHTTEELEGMVKEQKHLLHNMQFTHALSPVENPARMRFIRRDIARMLYVLHERKNTKTTA